MEKIYLAVDEGTTKLKAALVKESGEFICVASRSVEVLKPQEGFCEMNMTDLYKSFCETVLELKEKAPKEFDQIAGIGIDGQGDGCWMLDDNLQPLGNAILWNDSRAKTNNVPNVDDIQNHIREHHGSSYCAGTLPSSFLWLKTNEPERYKKIKWAFHCKDWLNFCLTGVIRSDYSDMSAALLDTMKKEYILGELEMLGVPEAAAFLPPLGDSTDIIGTVNAKAAKETGLKEGTPVIGGSIDVSAVAFGIGLAHSGDGASILGTTLSNIVLCEEKDLDYSDPAGSTLCAVLPNLYLRQMATSQGFSALDWAKGILAPDLSYPEMEEKAMKRPLGSGGIIFHPYLYGERAPFRDGNATAGFYGLTSVATRDDMLRSVYEGIALAVDHCFHRLPSKQGKVYVAGGGAKNKIVCKLIADALNRQVIRPSYDELGILGIAKAVDVAITKSVRDSVKDDGAVVFEPNAENHQKINEMYAQFVALVETMKPHWETRAKALKQ